MEQLQNIFHFYLKLIQVDRCPMRNKSSQQKTDKVESKFIRQEDQYEDYYPLDKQIKFNFDFDDNLDLSNIKSSKQFFKNNEILQKKIISYLIKMTEQVCSKSFNLLVYHECNEDQVKCYASKNILQNVKYLCLEMQKLLIFNYDKQQTLKIKQRYFKLQIQSGYLQTLLQQRRINYQRYQNLTRQIAEQICNKLKVAIEQKFKNYPSTNVSGYSLKLKKMVEQMDFRQDYSLQFLYLNKILINPHQLEDKQQKKDLIIRKIMEYLNAVIKAPHQIIQSKDQTYFQAFVKLNQGLTWIISQPNVSHTELQAILKEDQQHISNISKIKDFLISPKNNLSQLPEKYKKQLDEKKLLQLYEESLIKFKETNKYLANSKVPISTLQFDDNEILNGQFVIKSSAILRVLSKNDDDNRETVDKSQKNIRDNVYNFKNNKNQLIELDQEQRNHLYMAAKNIKQKTNKKLSKNNNQNDSKIFVVQSLLEPQRQQIKYSFENSLVISSRLNSYIIKETLRQLIELINILSELPRNAAVLLEQQLQKKRSTMQYQTISKTKNRINRLKEVNMICSRIGDLLRSKIFCNQEQFINLLMLLKKLNAYCQKNKKQNEPCFFKLIRIKNKLQDITNNVHVNYMLYGKIQCELQICFEQKDKILKYKNTMHHFLYQLIRGNYQIIPELANIVNRKDPVCLQNKSSNLHFQLHQTEKSKSMEFQQRTPSKLQQIEQIWRCIYANCNQYSLQGNYKFIKGDNNKYSCLKCYFKKNKNAQSMFTALRKLNYSKQNEWVRQLLERHEQFGLQQIDKIAYEQKCSTGYYLMIYPTEKKVICQLCIIYAREKPNKQLIIKSIERNSKLKTHEANQQLQKDHNDKKKIYIKISDFNKKNASFNLLTMDIYKEVHTDISDKIKQDAKEFDKKFLQEQIKNKQNNINLNFRNSVVSLFQEHLQNNKLQFVRKIVGQNLRIITISNYNKLLHLKQLDLKGNRISGDQQIYKYPNLSFLDLSNNRIESIQFEESPNLKTVLLNNNSNFTALTFSDLQTLLKRLQIQNNSIPQLDLKNCPAITKLVCNKQTDPIQIQFSLNVGLQELCASQLDMSNMKNMNIFQQQPFEKLQELRIKMKTNNIQKLLKLKSLKKLHLQLVANGQQPINLVCLDQYNLIQMIIEGVRVKKLVVGKAQQLYISAEQLQQLQINEAININIEAERLKNLQIVSWPKIQSLKMSQSIPSQLYLRKSLQSHQYIESSKALSQLVHSQNMRMFIATNIKLAEVNQFQCIKNAQLGHLHLQRFNFTAIELRDCQKLQNVNLISGLQQAKIIIDLRSLKQLIMEKLKISQLILRASSSIKKLSFDITSLKETPQILFDELDDKMDLQDLKISKQFQNMDWSGLFNRINRIKTLSWSIRRDSLHLSYFCCESIRQLILSSSDVPNFTIIIDLPIQKLRCNDQIKQVTFQFHIASQLEIHLSRYPANIIKLVNKSGKQCSIVFKTDFKQQTKKNIKIDPSQKDIIYKIKSYTTLEHNQ